MTRKALLYTKATDVDIVNFVDEIQSSGGRTANTRELDKCAADLLAARKVSKCPLSNSTLDILDRMLLALARQISPDIKEVAECLDLQGAMVEGIKFADWRVNNRKERLWAAQKGAQRIKEEERRD